MDELPCAFYFYLFLFSFLRRESLYIALVNLGLTWIYMDLPASASQVLGIKAHATVANRAL